MSDVESSERRRPRGGKPIGLGLLGCGVVGGGVLELLAQNERYLGERVGVPLSVRRVAVRDPQKARVSAWDPARMTTSADEVVDDPEVELVVELMGGEEPAGSLVRRALEQGKGVVTANKLLLAKRGPALVRLAHERRADLAFEAAVGGGIPIIRTLREAYASDWVEELHGIINGTCNYVLTKMREERCSFDEAVGDAQTKGYAEADPSLDVDGHDAAHKLVVLSMLAFGAEVQESLVHVEGLRGIEEADHRFAERFGYVVKHLAIGRDLGSSIELRVHPALVPQRSVLANVSGVLNAVALRGRAVGPSLLSGRGAGAYPTAVSVVADILDVARSIAAGVSGLSTRGISTTPRPIRSMDDVETRYYLRFTVLDRPGVMASLAKALGDEGVSIVQIVQEGQDDGESRPVDVVILTHRAREGAVRRALAALRGDYLVGAPRVLRIEEP
jgi:homoserine dehydrogenase